MHNNGYRLQLDHFLFFNYLILFTFLVHSKTLDLSQLFIFCQINLVNECGSESIIF